MEVVVTGREITKSPCPKCGAVDWAVRWQVMLDGRDCYPYCCRPCGYRSPIVEKAHVVLLQLEKYGLTKKDIEFYK